MARQHSLDASANVSLRSALLRRVRNWPPLLRHASLLIGGLTLVFGLLMINQARIARMAFDNAALEASIRLLRRQIAQEREQYLKTSDLEQVRAAAEAMGMIFPADGQIVRVDVPRRNYVTFQDKNESQEAQADRELDRAMQQVGEYMLGEAGEGKTAVLDAESYRQALHEEEAQKP